MSARKNLTDQIDRILVCFESLVLPFRSLGVGRSNATAAPATPSQFYPAQSPPTIPAIAMNPPPPPLPPPPLVPPLVRPPFAWWDAHPPAATPSGVASPLSTITFCHPGYPEQDNILFQLPALDTRAGSGHAGIHHGVALTACSIVAANTPGCLSVSRDPTIALAAPAPPWDHVLTATAYYFHTADGNDATYPICPDFASWRFPHNCLPEQWSSPAPEVAAGVLPAAPRTLRPVPASNMSAAVINRDESCRITDCRAGLNNSHIIPREELEWVSSPLLYIRYCRGGYPPPQSTPR